MSTPLENRPWWNDVVAKLKSRKLRDLAREHKVSVAELQDALMRTGHMTKSSAPEAAATQTNAPEAAPAKGRGGRKPASAKTAPAEKAAAEKPAKKPAAKPAKAPKAAKAPEAAADTAGSKEAAKSDAKTEGGRANERLEQIRDQLGKISDGDAAELAGVARKTVVEFRKRHGIGRYRADSGAEGRKAEAKAAPAPAPAPAAAAPEAPVKRKPGRPRKTEQAPKAEKPAKAPKAAKAAPATAKVEEEAAGAADESDASKATGRASKLDAFLHIVGKRPDREVAEESGMTTENVRMYRLRRGIAAEWRGEGGSTRGAAKAARGARAAAPAEEVVTLPVAEKAAPAAEKAPAKAVEKAAPAAAEAAEGNTKVDRAIAKYIHEIGKVPDAEIAEKAGISRSAVSAYRQRHGIKASGRGGRPPGSGRAAAAPATTAPVAAPAAPAAKAAEKAPEAKAPVAKAPEAKAPEAKAPEAKAPEAKAPAAKAATGAFVYRIVATRKGEEKVFGVAAGNVVEAAQIAYERLTGRDDSWVIEKIRLLGSSLP